MSRNTIYVPSVLWELCIALPISICILSDKTIEIETSSVAVIIDIHLYLNNKKHSVIIKMRIIICVATIIIISDIRGQQE